MSSFSGRRWALYFVVAAVLLMANAAIFYRSNQASLNATHLVGQSRKVLISLSMVLATLDEAETGQRGYLLTGDMKYLEPYTRARANVESSIAGLREAAAGDPGDRGYIEQIEALTAAKLEELRRTVALQRNHQHAAALQLVLSNSGQRTMEQLRGVINAMTTEENTELAQRMNDAQSAAQREQITILLASLGNLLLLGALAFVTQRALAARERVAEERSRLLDLERDARARAEAAVRMREEFLTVAAHELNTPLTALQGSAQLLQQRAQREGTIGERNERLLNLLVAQASRFAHLVGMVLDTSRLQSERLTLITERLDVVELVRQVAQEMQTLSTRHTIHLEIPRSALTVSGDATRLQQVLHNLIQNAIKYSPRGGAVQVRVAPEEEQVAISVRDSGIGIPAADLPHIFDRFFRASNTDVRSISGIGMGLYVAHGIIALHGGVMTVASVEGEGTTFTVRLPRAADEGAEARGGALIPGGDATVVAEAAMPSQGTHR